MVPWKPTRSLCGVPTWGFSLHCAPHLSPELPVCQNPTWSPRPRADATSSMKPATSFARPWALTLFSQRTGMGTVCSIVTQAQKELLLRLRAEPTVAASRFRCILSFIPGFLFWSFNFFSRLGPTQCFPSQFPKEDGQSQQYPAFPMVERGQPVARCGSHLFEGIDSKWAGPPLTFPQGVETEKRPLLSLSEGPPGCSVCLQRLVCNTNATLVALDTLKATASVLGRDSVSSYAN